MSKRKKSWRAQHCYFSDAVNKLAHPLPITESKLRMREKKTMLYNLSSTPLYQKLEDNAKDSRSCHAVLKGDDSSLFWRLCLGNNAGSAK